MNRKEKEIEKEKHTEEKGGRQRERAMEVGASSRGGQRDQTVEEERRNLGPTATYRREGTDSQYW